MPEITVEKPITTQTATEALRDIAGKETTSQAARGMLDFTGAMVKRINETPVTFGTKALTQLDEDPNLTSEFSVPIDTQGIIRIIVSLN